MLVDWVVGLLNTLMAFKTWQTGPGLLDGTEAELALEVRMVASEDVGLVDLQVLLMGRLISLPILPTNFTRYAGAFPVVVVLVLKELPYFLSVTFSHRWISSQQCLHWWDKDCCCLCHPSLQSFLTYQLLLSSSLGLFTIGDLKYFLSKVLSCSFPLTLCFRTSSDLKYFLFVRAADIFEHREGTLSDQIF